MENTPVDIQELIRQGRLIEAIKALRETSGLDLKTAKQQVEAWQKSLADDPRESPSRAEEKYGINNPSASIPDEVRKLLLDGKKLDAIIWQREKTQTGLKEAKEQVDKWHEELRLQYPENFLLQKRSDSGCATIILVIAVVILGLICYFMVK